MTADPLLILPTMDLLLERCPLPGVLTRTIRHGPQNGAQVLVLGRARYGRSRFMVYPVDELARGWTYSTTITGLALDLRNEAVQDAVCRHLFGHPAALVYDDGMLWVSEWVAEPWPLEPRPSGRADPELLVQALHTIVVPALEARTLQAGQDRRGVRRSNRR